MKIILIALVLVSFSCASQKRCLRKVPPVTSRDSIFIQNVVKDTLVIPGDSLIIEIPINCPDQEVVLVENGKLKQTISILNGRLMSNTIVKRDTIYLHTTETKTIVKEGRTVQVKYLPKFWKVTGWTGIISILLIIAYFVLKIIFRR